MSCVNIFVNQKQKTNLIVFINDLIIPIITNIFEKSIQINDNNDDKLNANSSELMNLCMQCLEILICINNTKRLKQSPNDIINSINFKNMRLLL